MTPESNGEEYFYSQLLLHRPWQVEDRDLMAGYDTHEAAFLALGPQLVVNANRHERYANEVEAAVERLQALDPQ